MLATWRSPNPEFLSGIADFLKENLEAIKRLMFWMTLDTFGSMSHVDDCVNMGGKKKREGGSKAFI